MTDATWKVRPTTWKVQLAIRDHLSNSLKQCWPKRREQGKCDARVNTHPKFGWFNTFLKTCHWRKLLEGDVLYNVGRKRTKNSLKIFFKDALDTRWWITKEVRSAELAITNFTFNEPKWHNCFIESSTYKISLIIIGVLLDDSERKKNNIMTTWADFKGELLKLKVTHFNFNTKLAIHS